MPTHTWYTYILRCSDGSYYVGHTDNLGQRLRMHNAGRGAAWTVGRRPVRLVYEESHATEAGAMQREQQIKGRTRLKKEALIANDLTRLKRLSISRSSPRSRQRP